MKKKGFYIIKDQFFKDMSDPYLKGNKEGMRPHYYCFEDTSTGIYWMIPLSSRIEKFRRIIEKKEKSGKPCVKFMPTQPDVMSILEKLKKI